MAQSSQDNFDPIRMEFMLTGMTDYLPIASAAKGMYDAFLKQGFPDARAYELTKAILVAATGNQTGGNAK